MNKDDKQTIYEIYRACRLCGAGAGYKMPIVQSVIDLDGDDVELKQKIKECLQIEVNNNDRMPPLVCELCVDKINDFFEFRKMCLETNKNTRLRLGLPLEALPQEAPSVEDKKSLVSETVYIDSDSDEGEPLNKQQSTPVVKNKSRPKSAKAKNEVDVRIKIQIPQPVDKEETPAPTPEPIEKRETRKRRAPSPKRPTRQSVSDDFSLNELLIEDNALLVPRQKRPREVPLHFPPPKRARPASETPTPEKFSKPGPKSSKVAQKPPQPQKQVKPPPRPGPKSRTKELSPVPPPKSKPENTPLPAPKAKKNELTPSPSLKLTREHAASLKMIRELAAMTGPKSKKPELTTTPGSKKREVTPVPGPRTKEDVTPVAGPKSKKTEVTPSPGPKSKKTEITPSPGPKSKKTEVTPSPGPKSKKTEVTPSPGPKSKKAEVTPSPGPKSKKTEITPSPGPKSNKTVVTPFPGPKSKKAEVTPSPGLKITRAERKNIAGPRSKKREISPALSSKRREPSPSPSRSKKREASPQPASRASPLQKNLDCCVCGYKAKSTQGMAGHIKSHVPSFTPARLACNACEEWFATTEEAGWHLRRHTNKSLAYTCSKCYDDFRTADDYELHFTRNQCLPTYEVPDVKCDECWHEFPTYKLLEDHKCPGEGGRPGGECSKCGRSYTLLRHQIAHEMKCNVRKKGVPIVDPEVSSRMLPMQVRIVKCDLLLKNATDHRCDVSKLSHRFGLDRSSTYPYLYSMDDIRIKTEPDANQFDHMVSIKDEIKEEYLNNDTSYVHWDSDGTDDSDTPLNVLDKKKSVDSLSKMSLKTIFSPKCLGKVPRKKRKIKHEKEFDSIMSFNLKGEIGSNIDNIIDSLGKEQPSDKYDSDSRLDKTQSLNSNSSPTLNIFECVKISVSESIKDGNKIELDPEKESDESYSNKSGNNEDIANQNHAKIVGYKTQTNFINEQNTGSQNDVIDSQVNDNSNIVTNDSNTESNKTDNSHTQLKAYDVSEVANDNDANCNNHNSLDNRLTNDTKNGHIVNKQIVNENPTLHVGNKVEMSVSQTDEFQKMEVDESIEQNNIGKEIGNATDISSALLENTDIEISKTHCKKSFPINHKHEIDTNFDKEDSQSSDVINYKAIDDLDEFEKDDSQSSSATNNKTDSDNTNIDSENNTADTLFDVPKSDSIEKINDNSEKDASKSMSLQDSVIRTDSEESSSDRFNINNLNEDDRRLMADLDAHIGENESKDDVNKSNVIQSDVIDANMPSNAVVGQNELVNFDMNDSPSVVNTDIGFDNCEEKKESLEELMQKRDADLRSLDLDSVSDEEFNFDI